MTHHYGPNPTYQAPAPKKPSRLKKAAVIGGSAVVLVVAAAVIFAPDQPASSTAVSGPVSTVTVTVPGPAVATVTAPPLPAATVTYTPPAPPKPAGFGPGTYLVGTDMEPGTYRSAGSETGCYWARQRNDAGDIIANDLVNGPGPARFTTKKGELVKISLCEFVKAS
jgi:hypothetical protein